MTDREEWAAFLAAVQPPTFLHSWEWGETQQALGEDVVRLGAYSRGRLCGIAQSVTVTARRGTFLHVPHGPVTTEGATFEATRALLTTLAAEAQRRRFAFLRISPILPDTGQNRALFTELRFRRAPLFVHAERLWILGLSPPEQVLLAGMRKTTRNLIRRAERDGVHVRLGAGPDARKAFFSLYRQTAARERFVPFTSATLDAEIDSYGAGSGVIVALAEWRSHVLAGAVVPLTSWSAFYHHGASSRDYAHIPATYALQWALLREAKRRGCREYNFWGIAPQRNSGGSQRNPAHPWAGLTLFKTGFGGKEVPLVPTRDLPLRPSYCVTAGIETLRRVRRRL